MKIPNSKNRQAVLFELFVALSLAVAYFFLVRNFFAFGNPMSSNVFTAASEKVYRLNQPFMGMVWNGRLSGLLLSGALTDYSLIQNASETEHLHRLMDVFGLYHACWLLLLFVCIIFALRHSLFVNFGIFAGLMYDFSPTSGPYFYPWDMPAMLFFTLAVLFFDFRKIWMMVATIFAGAFFKETVLVCALLIFFVDQWKWTKRVLLFAGLLAGYLVGKKFLMGHLGIAAPMFSPTEALHFHGSFSPSTFLHNVVENLKALFAPTLNSIIFVNAGTLAGVLILGWQRRFLPYMTVIITFIGGLFLFGPPPGISEIRDFIEILPLSLLLLSTLWIEYSEGNVNLKSDAEHVPLWPVRTTVRLVTPILIAVVALTTSISTMQYYILFADLQPANQAQSHLATYDAKGQKTATIEALLDLFQTGYVDTALDLGATAQSDGRDKEAIAEYEHVLALDTNSISALNNLAILLATDSDPRLRDGNRAVTLAQQACQVNEYHDPAVIYTLAAAYAEAGRFRDAVAAADKARSAALQQGQVDLIKENEPLVDLYKSGVPFHQESQPSRAVE